MKLPKLDIRDFVWCCLFLAMATLWLKDHQRQIEENYRLQGIIQKATTIGGGISNERAMP